MYRFLLAQLHFDSIRTKKTLKKMKVALNNLPTGPKAYDYAYEEAMNRITSHDQDSEDLAKQVLLWITCAKRPLTTTELQHALAVEISEVELDKENLPQIEDMVSVCAGLVTIEEESNTIRLVHYTTQEYFERTQEDWFPNAQAHITTISITYLSFSVFKIGYCQSDYEFEKRLLANPLYDYAARNWGHHARGVSTLSQILNFLSCQTTVQASSQALMTTIRYGQHDPREMTGLHLTAYFGLDGAAEALCQGAVDVNSKDSHSRTPLSYAAERGHEAIVKLLLEHKADVDLKDSYGQTPLSCAAERGHEAIAKLLLEHKADIDLKDSFGQTPLSCAAERGHEAIAKLLLEYKADVDLIDKAIVKLLSPAL